MFDMRKVVFLILAWSALGQQLSFEVASVKPTPPPEPNARQFFGPPRGGPGTRDPGQITWSSAALRNIVMTAYDVQTFQVTAPDWMASERYDIIAKVPAGATKSQINLMWQRLLKERFGMVLHHESKEMQVATLTIAKSGLKLKETTLDADAEPFTPGAGLPKTDKNGLPEMNGSGAIVTISIGNGTPSARMIAKGLPSTDIASRLAGMLQRPVIDKSGLTGKYDFILEFTPDLRGIPVPPAGGDATDPGTNIEAAVEKQLGLKLTGSKEKLDVIVVDSAQKTPTTN